MRPKKIGIAFDDISRATPAQALAEVVLSELYEAGIPKENIIFLCALGTHGVHTRLDFVRKLGENIVAEYGVYNHNCYENCVKIGTTKRGFHVPVNKELMSCDLKRGLGSIAPHIYNGFSGGGKILFPGMAFIDTIESNHRTAFEYFYKNKLNLCTAMGSLENSGMRKKIEEMALRSENFSR
jgi:lactate racemase